MAIKRFPLIEVSGGHREIGRGFGEATADGMRRFLDILYEGARRANGWTRAETLVRARHFLSLFERHCPHLVEEVTGLAEGADLTFEEALLLQLRAEVTHVSEGCSAFVLGREATATGQILIGQNSDMSPEMEELGLILKVAPRVGPRMIMFTFPGLLGYHGMNDAGVAHFANALPAAPWQMAMSHYPLKRMFLESSSVGDCLRLLDTVPVCSTGNYVLADGQGRIADAELTPTGYRLWPGDGTFVVHTNHYLVPEYAGGENVLPSYEDSVARYDRFRGFVGQKVGALDVSALKEILGDHAGYPTSICRHAEGNHGSKTIASLIAEPERGLLHVAMGNPCQSEYSTYAV